MFKVFDRSRRQRSTCRQLQSNSVTLRIITILVSVPFYAYNGRYAFPNVLSCKPNYIGFPVLAMTLIVGKMTVGNTPLIDIIVILGTYLDSFEIVNPLPYLHQLHSNKN